MDATRREKLSEEQLREFHDAFCAFDRRQAGYILNTDIKQVMRSLGFNPTEQEVDNMCMKVDNDGNGQVDFNEFIDLMLELENPELDQQSYLDTFRAFDNTGKGYIQASLIREILLDVMGQREKDKQHIIRVFQLDKDRKVNFEEFKLMIAST
ncbi:calmodulin-A-like isoform X2 [Rhopilema esculentum]|uniref:calmodulin-A-like isoform X2 n=1 Tax=Rhopilema esculentum TaxID=499914 RepID=UPI0031DBFCD4